MRHRVGVNIGIAILGDGCSCIAGEGVAGEEQLEVRSFILTTHSVLDWNDNSPAKSGMVPVNESYLLIRRYRNGQ